MISGAATITGLLGWPVAHSLSPRLHAHWLQQYHIDGAYIPLPVLPEHLGDALRAMKHMGFRGCNLTIPHKQAALSLVEEVNETARRIGAINTIIWNLDGVAYGTNTDAYGFIENVKSAHPNVQAYLEKVVVLGAGGAARAIICALKQEGAKAIIIMNRSEERACLLAQDMGPEVSVIAWENKHPVISEASFLINSTSLGMVHQPALDIPLESLPSGSLVYDLVYSPVMTPLLLAAQRQGNPYVTGIGMLAHQAAKAFECWHGILPEVDSSLLLLMEQWMKVS